MVLAVRDDKLVGAIYCVHGMTDASAEFDISDISHACGGTHFLAACMQNKCNVKHELGVPHARTQEASGSQLNDLSLPEQHGHCCKQPG